MNDLEAASAREGSGEMFDAIARRYDVMNRLLSLGMDQGWRRRTVASLELASNARVLDLATGTGDLAMAIAATHGDARVVGLDPSRGMLARAEEKVAREGAAVELVEGDAIALPFKDATFDGVTMAFGIRNVSDRPRALREMARVAKPSARVAILELSEPRQGAMAALARFHIRRVVPWLGAAISGAREYAYLQRSIAAFPPADEFADMMRANGFDVLRVEPLTFGVVNLFVGAPRARA